MANRGNIRRISTAEDLEEGSSFLANLDSCFSEALEMIGPLPLRRRKDGFEALFLAIVGQQISIAAGAAIWKRLKDAKLTGPRKVESASDDELRACGLSRPKVRYARALAAAKINYAALRGCSTEEVVETLTAIPGIGRWTAEIYALFALGHADAFASGDLALQEGAKLLFDLPERPSEKQLQAMATEWSPWRGVAARLLWSYYTYRKHNL